MKNLLKSVKERLSPQRHYPPRSLSPSRHPPTYLALVRAGIQLASPGIEEEKVTRFLDIAQTPSLRSREAMPDDATAQPILAESHNLPNTNEAVVLRASATLTSFVQQDDQPSYATVYPAVAVDYHLRESHEVNQSDASAPVTNILNRGNIYTGVNYGYLQMVASDNSVDLSRLNDLPTHPDTSGLLSDYFPESRAGDEAEISRWINNAGPSELVLCVLGGVGVGKTTLAKHLAEQLRTANRLAAAIFFGFARPEWGVESVVKLVAHQLGRAHLGAVGPICEAIRSYSGSSVTVETLVEKFILDPVRSLGLSSPLVVVLDALDQWSRHPSLVKALAYLNMHANLIRFLVIGRHGLEEQFQKLSTKQLHLLDVSTDAMAKYIKERFDDIPWKYERKPDVKTIVQLATKAKNMFIWTSTLCSLLNDQILHPNPQDTLDAILRDQDGIGDSDILTDLYDNAIGLRFPKAEHKEKLKVVLGAILVLQEPVSVTVFATLVSLDSATVDRIRSNLGPLQIGQPEDSKSMVYPASSIFHLSFLEYLRSTPTRVDTANPAFTINPKPSHFQLSKACLEELLRFLCIPQGSTSRGTLKVYAVKYWPIHTAHGTPAVSPTSDAEWRATPQCAIIESLTIAQLDNWAKMLFEYVSPGLTASLVDEAKDSGSAIAAATRSLTQTVIHTDESPFIIPLLEIALRLQHRSIDAWLRLAEECRTAGKSDASTDLIQRAIHVSRCAVDLMDSHKDHPLVLRALAASLYDRYYRLGAAGDLDEALSLERKALSLVASDHPDRPGFLNNLAISLCHRFESTGDIKNLDESIVLHREASLLWPIDHPYRPSAVTNLASSLHSQFEVTGLVESLEETIALHREALALEPSPLYPDRAMVLNNLGNSLVSHFELSGNGESIDEAIAVLREGLSLWPVGHPDRSAPLNNLAKALLHRFQLTGTAIENLDESITLHREALALRPPGHCYRALSLTNLADALNSHSKLTGSVASLEEPIAMCQEALSLYLPGNPTRTQTLSVMARCLLTRFEVQESWEDLEGCIEHARQVLELTPMAKRGERGALANMLGMALRHKPDQLQESQVYSRQAVEYSPQDWAILKNFATTLLLCHKQDPSQEYLKEAQFACEKALEWCPTEKREAIGALRTELAEELLNFLETAAFEPEL